MVRRLTVDLVVCLLLVGSAGGAPQYKVIILRCGWPVQVYGVSGGQQVGRVGWCAALWSGTPESYVVLNPAGIDGAEAYGVSGGQQVGYGAGVATGGADHALLWSGTAESYVDLNPVGFHESWAYGVSDGQQAGYAWGEITGWYYHALLWSGTAESYVDLNPSGFIDSWAYGISGGQQVGWGMPYGGGVGHALLWSGTAESCVDLNPSGFINSVAYGVSDGQQVGCGWGGATGGAHALLWFGTADSYVDLNPTGWSESVARGVSGGQQVGYGRIGSQQHAILWSGTADSYVDLHAFLPSGYNHSSALGIDSDGAVVGAASGMPSCAVLWVPDVVATAPTIGAISAAVNPVQVNTVFVVGASFSDPDAGDSHTAQWDWGDGTTSAGSVDQDADTVGGSHTYIAAGVYTLTLTVTDMTSASDTEVYEFVVVYDPSAGFVTGGGWLWSPVGPYPYMTVEGKANFAFVSKYQKGATAPTGNTEFQFKAGDLNFHSDSYDWLVVTGSDYAKFKGVGTINGAGGYKFQIWAGDKEPDTFRIRIWAETATGGELVVYDNGFDQEIGGGSIVIHTN